MFCLAPKLAMANLIRSSLAIFLLLTHSSSYAEQLVEIFSDTFVANQLDTSKWTGLQGDGKVGNEVSTYATTDIWQEHDHLLLQANIVPRGPDAPPAYYSGAVHSHEKFAFTYGEVEWHVKLPNGPGIYVGLSLVPVGCSPTGGPAACPDGNRARIEALQYRGDLPDRMSWMVTWGNGTDVRHDGSEIYRDGGFASPNNYHFFKVLWDDRQIILYVDGNERYKITEPDAIPHRPMYVMMQTAVGGWYAGQPDSTTPFPVIFVLNSVSVKRWQ